MPFPQNRFVLPKRPAMHSAKNPDIDAFFQQVKMEMTPGWIIQPEKTIVKELAAI